MKSSHLEGIKGKNQRSKTGAKGDAYYEGSNSNKKLNKFKDGETGDELTITTLPGTIAATVTGRDCPFFANPMGHHISDLHPEYGIDNPLFDLPLGNGVQPCCGGANGSAKFCEAWGCGVESYDIANNESNVVGSYPVGIYWDCCLDGYYQNNNIFICTEWNLSGDWQNGFACLYWKLGTAATKVINLQCGGGIIIPESYGCTESSCDNYDSTAEFNDGSCTGCNSCYYAVCAPNNGSPNWEQMFYNCSVDDGIGECTSCGPGYESCDDMIDAYGSIMACGNTAVNQYVSCYCDEC